MKITRYIFLALGLALWLAACQLDQLHENVAAKPVACFTSSENNCTAPCTIQFNADCSENASAYSWDFNGDGTSDGADKSINSTFDQPGTYTVTLIVQNGNRTDSSSLEVTIDPPLPSFTVAFEVDQQKCTAPCTIVFTNQSDAESYLWDFGDGATSQGLNPVHDYLKGGEYIVTLNGYKDGDTLSATKPITIEIDTFSKNIPINTRNLYGGSLLSTMDGGYAYIGFGGNAITDLGIPVLNDSRVYLTRLDENGEVNWTEVLDGRGHYFATYVQEMPNREFIVLGSSRETVNDPFQFLETQLDAQGQESDEGISIGLGSSFYFWTGWYEQDDFFFYDRFFVIAGGAELSVANNRGLFIRNYNFTSGNPFQNIRYHPSSSPPEEKFIHLFSLRPLENGDFIMAGVYDQTLYLLKTDTDGNELWSAFPYNSNNKAMGNSVRLTADGGFVIVGTRLAGSGIIVVKTDANGIMEWQKEFEGGGRGLEYSEDGGIDALLQMQGNIGRDIQQTDDEGYIVAGTYQENFSESRAYLIKLDKNGNEEWSQAYGEAGWNYQGTSVLNTEDGGYALGATRISTMGGAPMSSFVILKADNLGKTGG
ncbi:MAG: PKD domain-containing protein [Lewinellaceae bacterium]|nr:PKD domain-containing protein [Lewinellaceae bacterium]